jgi:hypothetical protein
MKTWIYSTALAVLECIAAIGFTPAQATMPAPNLRTYVTPSLTFEHCRRVYHCHWTSKGGVRAKRCHVCG